MNKTFAADGACQPDKHYMMDLSEKVSALKKMTEEGRYYTVARPVLGGKTTILDALERALDGKYAVIRLDLRTLGADDQYAFGSAAAFSKAMASCLVRTVKEDEMPEMIREALTDIEGRDPAHVFILELFIIFEQWISMSQMPVVLMIDNVDYAIDSQVLWDFLGMLASAYTQRQKGAPAFHSVILTGPVDIRFADMVMDEKQKDIKMVPWNIASDVTADLDFDIDAIRGMLEEYYQDHALAVSADSGEERKALVQSAAERIYLYTEGHPYLVSQICRTALEGTDGTVLTRIDASAQQLCGEDNRLFETMDRLIERYPEAAAAAADGRDDAPGVMQMAAYGFVRFDAQGMHLSGRIIEERLRRAAITTLQ